MVFTARLEIVDASGAVTPTLRIAFAVGMSVLERGGNTFGAAVAAGFVFHVLEPRLLRAQSLSMGSLRWRRVRFRSPTERPR